MKGASVQTVTSADGTTIAYDQAGSGPVLIVSVGAFCTRGTFVAPPELAAQFTVVTYDRRGRGDSGDTEPFTAQREYEDLAAVAAATGTEPPFIFGHSSGAAIALRAAAAGLPAAGIVALIIVACSRLPWIAAPCYFFGIPYLALVAAYHPRLLWRRYLEFGDYSYGTYVLAFPIQQLLIWQLGPLQSPMLFALTLAVTLPLAMVSWHMVEAPALALKSTLGAYRLRFSTGSRHARSRDS